MMKQFKLKLIVLLVVVISNVHLKCWALNASPSQLQQQQRHVGQLAPKNSSSVDRIVAILAAKPRSTGSAATVQSSDQQQAAKQSKANQPTRLHSEASTVDRKSVSEPTTGAIKNQGKRQTGDFADQTRPSRRNEDAWFLDQAPLPLQPYRFVYNVKDKNGLTEQYRQETGDGKFLTGSYGYVLPDGIFRHVDYVADDRGFR